VVDNSVEGSNSTGGEVFGNAEKGGSVTDVNLGPRWAGARDAGDLGWGSRLTRGEEKWYKMPY